ncbi:MAG: aminomethyl-transferring glycine dehydrogenase, partial [Candidatus Margulisiibacteriota bacterium]|nr:aminomethyl-transferring glycine dehydrogenase [Candidatus Margulisiibacteriota bacterium]
STIFMSAQELGAEIAIGSAQRLGVAMGYGGPSAAFLACSESFTRLIPGRIIGLSKDKFNKPAFRMALQTREQHIRRERATSNICTAQSLLAIINSFFAVYHGPEGLKDIALTIKAKTDFIINALKANGFEVTSSNNFDTLSIVGDDLTHLNEKALSENIEWNFNQESITLSLNQTITDENIQSILNIFDINESDINLELVEVEENYRRQSIYMTQDVFHKHHSETKMLRYIKSLEQKDLSLAHSMIPLGSCTMKLNATIELLGLSNPNFTNIHPFSNEQFTKGYKKLLTDLEDDLSLFTGFDGTSLQPNSGAQGEFAGLMCIRDYFESINESHRDVALIPTSAHGTNPASASLCGLKIVQVKCLESGEICIDDLDKKIEKHNENIAAIMITYPSTFGVFDENIKTICKKIHDVGGQVYMDGANMNAQVGLTSPATIGADVCHLNLHKTFCIPHGGGGPGVGPICVKSHLVPFLPSIDNAISNTNYGSASICIISYAYIKLMGTKNLKKATQIAILNANYIAKRLTGHYEVMYTNKNNCVAHELIINCKKFKKESKVTVEDIAKRLMDYGFHAPTMSWPVPDTLMIEPTESEGKDEIDRFCDTLIEIKKEIDSITIEDVEKSPLKNAPHTIDDLNKEWQYNYSTSKAFFPLGHTSNKFWPSVNRIDNAFGDRNLICSCQTFDISNNLEKNKINA